MLLHDQCDTLDSLNVSLCCPDQCQSGEELLIFLQSPVHGFHIIIYALVVFSAGTSFAQIKAPNGTEGMILSFGGVDYLHRWSKDGQHEFTPQGDMDLATWLDMITVNLHEMVTNGEQLATLANNVLSLHQKHGRLLRIDSKARTADSPAEHLVMAVFCGPSFLKSAIDRVVLVGDVGEIAVYSHRVYRSMADRH